MRRILAQIFKRAALRDQANLPFAVVSTSVKFTVRFALWENLNLSVRRAKFSLGFRLF